MPLGETGLVAIGAPLAGALLVITVDAEYQAHLLLDALWTRDTLLN